MSKSRRPFDYINREGGSRMLRITTQSTPDRLALKLEGWLTGAWVGELDHTWRAAANTGRQICVDLSEVYFVDEPGRQLLTSMYRAGVAFVTRGCVMPELVREISESAGLARSH
jgi:anti-anti-sigma regulatory factor